MNIWGAGVLLGTKHPLLSFVPGGWGRVVLTGVQFCSFVAHLPSASPAYRVFVFIVLMLVVWVSRFLRCLGR